MNRASLLICALVQYAGAPPAQAQIIIRADVNLVQVNMRVTDSEGHSVPGLKKENFELFVDGVRLSISQFQDEDAPVTAGIVVDNSASMGPKREEVIAAAMAFARASNPRDQMFVVHFNEQARFGLPESTPFTSKVDELQAAISKMEVGGTTALYDAISLARSRFRRAFYGRKVLLVITDGGDNSSKASFADVLKGAIGDGAVVFAIGIFDKDNADSNPGLLTQLAQATGGEAYFPTEISAITSLCEQIAGEVRRQYTIAFKGEEDGKYHRIRAAASAPDRGPLTVHARAGYFAAKP
jgi:Ca-activated chloride channel family protein